MVYSLIFLSLFLTYLQTIYCNHLDSRTIMQISQKCNVSNEKYHIAYLCPSMGIRLIPQLEETNITYLNLNLNHIEKIPKRSLTLYTKLQIISLERNKIHYIESGSFEQLKHLKELNLAGNAIRQFIEKLPTIHTLALSLNPLSYFDIGKSHVKKLILDYTNLVKLPNLTHTPHLEYLSLNKNAIEELQVEDVAPACSLRRLELAVDALENIQNWNSCECSRLVDWLCKRKIEFFARLDCNIDNLQCDDNFDYSKADDIIKECERELERSALDASII